MCDCSHLNTPIRVSFCAEYTTRGFKVIRSATIFVRKLPWFTVLHLITETTTEHFSNKPAKPAVKWNIKSTESEGVSHSDLKWHTTEWQTSRFKYVPASGVKIKLHTFLFVVLYGDVQSATLPHPQFILGNGVLTEAGRLWRGREQNPDSFFS